jgi:hypothetical protein
MQERDHSKGVPRVLWYVLLPFFALYLLSGDLRCGRSERPGSAVHRPDSMDQRSMAPVEPADQRAQPDADSVPLLRSDQAPAL